MILMSQIPHSRTPLFLHWILKTPQLVNKTSRQAMRLNLKPVSTEISYIGCMDGVTSYFWELDLHSISPKTNSRSNSYRHFHTTCRGHRPGNSVNAPLLPRGGVHPDRVHPGWMNGWVWAWMDKPLASFSSMSTAAW